MQDSSKRVMTKLWNSSKFVLSHLKDFDHNSQPAKSLPIDRWIVERTNETVIEASKWLYIYEIGLARKVADEFFWKDFCDYYIELVKERLYQPQIHGEEERRSAQAAIAYSLLTILKMYAIYMPHETEYIYQKGFKELDKAVSIHLTQWPKPTAVDGDILAFGEMIKQAVAEVRKYKSEHNLSMKEEIESVTITGSAKYRQWVFETEKDLIACTHGKCVIYAENDR
jgi:valyl-tRNA synthetase